MLRARWVLLVVYSRAVGAAECLVGCAMVDTSPFDDGGLAVWAERSSCDGSIGCDLSLSGTWSTSYPYAQWAGTSGVDGSSACTCNVCNPRDYYASSYMEDYPIWTRIQCYIAASEAAGYDMSPCVAAVMDEGTLACVDDVFAVPSVSQFECATNDITEIGSSSSVDAACVPETTITRQASEMFTASAVEISASASSASGGGVVSAGECLVGCAMTDTSPYDDAGLAVWGQRSACDGSIGCDLTMSGTFSTSYPYLLWASTSGIDGSSACTCNVCNPRDYAASSYMEDYPIWTRIQCYIAASEAAGYDMSPCVAAVMDERTVACVDDAFEIPSVNQFECASNGITEIGSSSSVDAACILETTIARQASEMFNASVVENTASGGVVSADDCLVGCAMTGTSPYDDTGLAVWGQRSACDGSIGCDLSMSGSFSTSYPYLLWASTSGSDGSSACTCNVCNPRDYSASSYMEDYPIWTRIQCYIAASEAAGYDMSPCVAAVVDEGTVTCVDDVFAIPSVSQFECDANGITEIGSSSSVDAACVPEGNVTRLASEMFSASAVENTASASTTSGGAVVSPDECLVGCALTDTSPYDDAGLAVWGQRSACDGSIGCDLTMSGTFSTSYPYVLWADTSGIDGSSACTCNVCNPRDFYASSYMEDYSMWTRIQCYIAASEAAGYDMSPCVAAVMDEGTVACVDDVFAMPSVSQFECAANGITEIGSSSSVDAACVPKTNTARQASEMFGGDPAPSPASTPTVGDTTATEPSPAPTGAREPSPAPIGATRPSLAPIDATVPSPAPIDAAGPSPAPIDATEPSPAPIDATEPSPAPSDATEPSPAPTSSPVIVDPSLSPETGNPTADPNMSPRPTTVPSIAIGATPAPVTPGTESCASGKICPNNLCCHPDSETCGRKYTFCQERNSYDGSRCCSGSAEYISEANVCREDSICDVEDERGSTAETVEMWVGIAGGVVGIFGAVGGAVCFLRKRNKPQEV